MGPVVSLMRVVGNCLEDKGSAAVGQWLTALTALQTLNLSCKALYLVALSEVWFEVCDEVVARGCFMRALLCR